MSQISFAEWFKDVKNRQKVAEGILTNKALRENYDEKDWREAKSVLEDMRFPDQEFKEKATKVNAGESHETGKETHGLVSFELNEDIDDFPLKWRVNYCPVCKKVITKSGVITNDLTGTAYRKWFVRYGNTVTDDTPEEVEKPKVGRQTFEKVLDDLSSLGGDLDGK